MTTLDVVRARTFIAEAKVGCGCRTVLFISSLGLVLTFLCRLYPRRFLTPPPNFQSLDPKQISVPVIGGHAGVSILPLLSRVGLGAWSVDCAARGPPSANSARALHPRRPSPASASPTRSATP